MASISEAQIAQDLQLLPEGGESCGTKPFTCEVLANPWWLVSGLHQVWDAQLEVESQSVDWRG